jgi:FkbM family methyltransferase
MKIKNFFKRPIYKALLLSRRWLNRAINHLHNKELRKRQNHWNRLFNNQEKIIYDVNDDFKIILHKDNHLSKRIYKGFEVQETNYLKSILKEGDIFVDIGANVGWFSLVASPLVGNSGKIICFEPTSETFKNLLVNIEINNFRNIDCRNIGLSDISGELTFYLSEPGRDARNSFAPILGESIQTVVSTLDNELMDIDKSLIKVVKVDVEGWEKFVFIGGENFFRNYRPIVMVEFAEENTFKAGYSVYDLYDIFQEWGYNWFRIVDDQLIAVEKEIHYSSVNLIAIKT